jgi:hypothetical protein
MTTVVTGLLGHEGQEFGSLQAFARSRVSSVVGDRNLENSLCHVHADASIVSHDGLLLLLPSSDSGTSMPIESQEESISSLELTKLAQAM